MSEAINSESVAQYFVLKTDDMLAAGLTQDDVSQLEAINKKVDEYRSGAGKPALECVVVEKGWPEYEPTCKAIEQRAAASI